MPSMSRHGAARGTAYTNPGYDWQEGRRKRVYREQVKDDRSPGKGAVKQMTGYARKVDER